MRANEKTRKAFAPVQKLGFRCLIERHREHRAHGGAHSFQRIGVGGVADQDDALGTNRIGGADNCTQVSRIAHAIKRDINIVAFRLEVCKLLILLFENANHHLRIIAAGDCRHDLFSHFEHQSALGEGACCNLLDHLVALARLGKHERLDAPVLLKSIDDELKPFCQKNALLIAIFFQCKRTQIFDNRIGKACDFLHLPHTRT